MYNVRVKKLRNVIQIRLYSDFVHNGDSNISKQQKEINPFTEKKEVLRTWEELEKAEQRSFAVSRTRSVNKIYDIARCNDWNYFFTLTFNPEKVDSFDYDLCTKKLSQWLKNMKKKSPDMKYIVVPEKHKSGRYHFHGLFANCEELGFVDSGKRDKKNRVIYNVGSYRLGFSTATCITDCDKASAYMCKYITKDLVDCTKGKKRYWASRNVELPEVSEYVSHPNKVLKFVFSQEGVYCKTIRSDFRVVHYLELPIYTTNTDFSKRYRHEFL